VFAIIIKYFVPAGTYGMVLFVFYQYIRPNGLKGIKKLVFVKDSSVKPLNVGAFSPVGTIHW
jgi:hypothetical protein